ncbi:MAG: SGNH/GDSL hydrolase family protein [Planctomycetaceae bacterium]|nr:SGNH/GDSL hydrolase family protein [Planctomycetaceae bacterium]
MINRRNLIRPFYARIAGRFLCGRVILLLCFLICSRAMLFAQKAEDMKFVDVDELMLIGQGFAESHVKYGRLPADMEKEFRPALRNLGTNSAGLAVRFSSNSKAIAVRWIVRGDNTMNHMASTGIKGLDLYSLDNGKWYYAGTARPAGKTSVNVVVQNMSGDMREYIAYFPLYDGVESVKIGVEQNAVIGKPVDNRLTKRQEAKPVVFYGTSITQGGCASRPGMAYPSILGRMLNRETVNLGFSGNGKLDFSLAEAISRIDAEAVVIDCLPNNTAQTVKDRAYRFITHIAKTKPTMKIFMLEKPEYPFARFNLTVQQEIAETNKEWKTLYSKLKNEGFQQLVYVEANGLIGNDGEATVDGVHFTDLGFLRYAETLFPYLKEYMVK